MKSTPDESPRLSRVGACWFTFPPPRPYSPNARSAKAGCRVASDTNPPNIPGAVPGPLLVDAKAASALLCMGARRLWVLTNCRAIPSHKIGRSVRYSPAELAAWIRTGCPTEGGAGDRVRKAVNP